MMTRNNKRYYWLKLPEDFFRQKEIKQLRKIAGGDVFTIIYLKMLLRSLKDDGRLYYEGIDDGFVSELAMDIDEDVENVKITVAFLMAKGILEQKTSDEYALLKAPEMMGSESYSAERVRRHRLNQQKALQCNAPVTACNEEIDIEIDIEKDIEKDKTNISSADDGLPDGFAEFWKIYPRHMDKAKAVTAWKGLKPGKKLIETILADVKYRNETVWKNKEKRFILMPTTYIHGKRWEDEHESDAPVMPSQPAQTIPNFMQPQARELTPDEQKAMYEAMENGTFFKNMW